MRLNIYALEVKVKATLLIVLTLSAVTLIKGSCADVLNGAILTDRVLGSGIHQIDGYASVAAGVTLTIEGGATLVASNNASLAIAGKLVSLGVPGNPVTFTTAGNDTWHGLRFVNSETTTLSGAIFENATTAIRLDGFSEVLITNNVFRNNVVAITDYGGYQPVSVSFNSFINNRSAFAGIRTLGSSAIIYNNFVNNDSVLEYGYYFGTVTVTANNFIGNLFVARAPEAGFGYGILDLRGNFWGETSLQDIPRLIYDINDDAILQRIEYMPILSAAVPLAGSNLLPVPEPSVSILMLAGMLAIWLYRAGFKRRVNT